MIEKIVNFFFRSHSVLSSEFIVLMTYIVVLLAGRHRVESAVYDGFTTRKVLDEKVFAFDLSSINNKRMDEIYKNIERLCV